jgi:ankyrin repeat protein
VDVVDDEGNTPLHDAVASYKDDVVLLLVNDSRALDIQNKKRTNTSSLGYAARQK